MRMFENITNRWKQHAKRSTSPLTILSPYITKGTVMSLVAGKASASIYTLFNVEVFATGGSDLGDIVKLMAKHKVYKLDRLHAKVVTDHTSFITVGSQNLTQNGQHNLELSVSLNGEAARRQAMDIVEPWLDAAELITPAMVADMESEVGSVKKLYDEFLQKCESAQTQINLRAKRRASRSRYEAHLKGRALIEGKLKRALASSPTKSAEVKRASSVSTPCLKTDAKENLLRWKRADGSIHAKLEKGERYLCFLENNEFGWARVAGQQITRIGRGITYAPGVLEAFSQLSFQVSASGKSLIGQPDGTNLVVNLLHGERPVCTVPAKFQLDSVNIFPARRPKAPPARAKRSAATRPVPLSMTREVMAWIAENEPEFEKLVHMRVTESFNYADGSKLTGVDAASFFGKLGSRVTVRVVNVDDNPILHVSPLKS